MPSRSGTRFEFRCWAQDLSAERRILDADWHKAGEDESRESYYLGRADFSIKARDGAFEVKERVGQAGRLERWEPLVQMQFPLSMDELAPWLDQAFGVGGAATAGDEEMDQAALEAFLKGQRVRIVAVAKRRTRYSLSTLLAEHVRVTLDTQAVQSVAVESADAAATDSALKLLHIEDRRNEAYPAALARLAGAQ